MLTPRTLGLSNESCRNNMVYCNLAWNNCNIQHCPFKIALDSVILSLAILALVWIHIARKSLSKGSSLRRFASYIFLCLSFMFLYSVWSMTEQILISEFYLKYLWFTLAYLFLIVSSYKLMKIGVEFGFSTEARDIKKILKQRKKQKRKAGKKVEKAMTR